MTWWMLAVQVRPCLPYLPLCGASRYLRRLGISKGKTKQVNANEDIRAFQVRVIDSNGEQLGILNTKVAMATAYEQGLDLVEVSPNADPPVCRIMDYGKYKYQLSKRKQEAKKKQSTIQVKEVKLRLKTEMNDIRTKLKHLRRFIGEGNKVKISVVFRGREIAHNELAYDTFDKIMNEIRDEVLVEANPHMEGRAMVMMVGPKS